MLLDKVNLGENQAEKVKQVESCFGKEVILEDTIYGWLHVKLQEEKTPEGTYLVDQLDSDKGPIVLHYQDLRNMVLVKNPRF